MKLISGEVTGIPRGSDSSDQAIHFALTKPLRIRMIIARIIHITDAAYIHWRTEWRQKKAQGERGNSNESSRILIAIAITSPSLPTALMSLRSLLALSR